MTLERRPGIGQERQFSERVPYAGNIRTLRDIHVSGKGVLVRVDLDFKEGEEKTSRRFFVVEPTVKGLEKGGVNTITLLAHNGDYKSLQYLVKPLEELLQEDVAFTLDNNAKSTEGRRVVLFENTRLWREKGEEKNDPNFAAYMAKMGDAYVGNAFATSHRAHASIVGIPALLESKAVGLQVEEEVNKIDEALFRPKEGFIVVIGGAKIKTKLPVINYMSKIAETVLVGGILPAEIEKEKIILPDNVVVAQLDKSRDNKDIALGSAENFAKILREAKTIVWNGAMGVFEQRETAQGTLIVVRAMAYAKSNNNAYLLAGGGETEAFLKENNLEQPFNHISTGGGAMLEYVSGNKMPALEVLRK